jgi:hypothetical protein
LRDIEANVVGIIRSDSAPHFGHATGSPEVLTDRSVSNTSSQLSQKYS